MNLSTRSVNLRDTAQPSPLDVPAETCSLVSRIGIDYSGLRDLVKAGEWQKADLETGRLLLTVSKQEALGYLLSADVNKFPCEDLQIINSLWFTYSQGRFGFSAQKQVYQSLVKGDKYDEILSLAFGDRVGWRVKSQWLNYKELTFSTDAPPGHLPFCLPCGKTQGTSCIKDCIIWRFHSLLDKLDSCAIS